jgi:hypothetical protein
LTGVELSRWLDHGSDCEVRDALNRPPTQAELARNPAARQVPTWVLAVFTLLLGFVVALAMVAEDALGTEGTGTIVTLVVAIAIGIPAVRWLGSRFGEPPEV